MRQPLLAILLALLTCLAGWGSAAMAHDVRPAYLQIDRIGPEKYRLVWRTPLLSGAPLPVALSLPPEARTLAPPTSQTFPGNRVERSLIEVAGGLEGKRIAFPGLEATITDVLVRVDDGDGRVSTELVRPSKPWIDLDPERGRLDIALTYLHQGVVHILLGVDHLLFVLALLLLVRGWPMLLKTVTAFTVAHSITLALATFGLLRLPVGPVETMIAASILLVAVEAVRFQRGEASFSARWPWVVAFVFGLLHGCGFAGALRELGLPQGDIPLALLMFNLGVEVGQLAFIGVVLAVLALVRKIFNIPAQAVLVPAYAIGMVASFWTIERVFATFS